MLGLWRCENVSNSLRSVLYIDFNDILRVVMGTKCANFGENYMCHCFHSQESFIQLSLADKSNATICNQLVHRVQREEISNHAYVTSIRLLCTPYSA